MRNSTKSKPKMGYKSQRPKPAPRAKPMAEPEAPKRPSVPLPGTAEGIQSQLLAKVLKSKVKLLRHLFNTVGETVSVSIEVYGDEWVLMVHGPNPQLRYFDDYKVFWARSKLLSQ